MTRGIQDELHAFTTALLERRGGLIEWPDPSEEGVAVLTPDMARALDSEETLAVSCEAGGEGLSANLATDFLERVSVLLAPEPRVGAFQVPSLYLKQGAMDDAVDRAFTWLNAKVRAGEAKPARVQYHTWWFFACVVSDDRWEDLFAVTLNAESGVEIALPDPLGLWDLEPLAEGDVNPASTYERALKRAQVQLKTRAAEFAARMDSRLEQDRKRVQSYYKALLRETRGRRGRGKPEDDAEKTEAKHRAVHLELRRKLAELGERYAMEMTLTPVVLICTDLPVLAVECQVFRKRARRTHTIYWNPVTKELEPLCCSRCGAGAFSAAFTDADVQPLCASCS